MRTRVYVVNKKKGFGVYSVREKLSVPTLRR